MAKAGVVGRGLGHGVDGLELVERPVELVCGAEERLGAGHCGGTGVAGVGWAKVTKPVGLAHCPCGP